MKSNDGKVSISIRKFTHSSVIQLRLLPIGKHDKKISTGKEPNEDNMAYFKTMGLLAWEELVNKKKKPLTFREFTPMALTKMNVGVRVRTAKDNEGKINKHLMPFFGDMLLKDIDSDVIEEWQDFMRVNKRSSNLTGRCKNLLERILKRAITSKLILTNEVANAEHVKSYPNENLLPREIYTKDEIKKMLSLSTGWLRVFIVVRFYLGLRSNEVIGLKWEDVDFESEKVSVLRGIIFGEIAPPKKGVRVVDLPLEAKSALLEHKESSETEWVFVNSRGTHWGDCSYVNRRHFQPFLKRIGIKYKSFYSFRHCFVTYNILGDNDVPYVAKQAGHKNVKQTLDAYLKYAPGIGGVEKTNKALSL